MTHTRYVALLRGINVGGGNFIKMAALQACFQAAGLEQVRTYIQSGNVLFATAATDEAALTARLEHALSATFPPYQAQLVLHTAARLHAIGQAAPAGLVGLPIYRQMTIRNWNTTSKLLALITAP